jgi:hypothetical protein
MWYRRREQPMRLSSWYAMNGVVNMVSDFAPSYNPSHPDDLAQQFGSLIAFGLGHIKSSLAPYQVPTRNILRYYRV